MVVLRPTVNNSRPLQSAVVIQMVSLLGWKCLETNTSKDHTVFHT